MLPMMLAAMVQGGPPRTGAYVSRVGATVVAQESYRFDGTLLSSQVIMVGQSLHLATETRYGSGLVPGRFHVDARSSAGGPVIQTVDVVFGDSAHWTVAGGGQSQSGAITVTPPYTVLQNLQFSHVAVALLRYDRAKGGPQTMNAWVPQGGVVVPVEVTITGDSGIVRVAGTEMRITLDRSGWLHGLRAPSQGLNVEWADAIPAAPAEPQVPQAGTADTVAPSAATETSYAFMSGPLSIAGTLTLPRQAAAAVPVVVLVAGSGPTDRDGNSRLGVHANTYAQIAWRLAERGIATLRYDKRGLGQSSKQFDMAQTTFDDFAADAAAAVKALAADRRFSRVVILGHSEGAGLAVRAANAGAPLAGVALVAGLGRPFAVVLREQLAAQFDSASMATYDRAFAAYLRGEPTGSLPAAMQGLVAPINRRFMQTSLEYQPAEEVARIREPVLIVQGERDIQVSVADARALKAAKPAAQLVLLPEANHVLKRVANGGRGSQASSYADPTLAIDPAFVDALAGWILGLR
jgi:pimeloyl-ACP methyl ester carboxylesterase